MKVVLISGKAESGKTTTANFLKSKLEEQGKKAVIVPYGQYVKDTAKMIFGWDGKKDESGRRLLQWWGTDVVRETFPDFWVDTVIRLAKVFKSCDKSKLCVDYIIIDDVRFQNEIDAWFYEFESKLSYEYPNVFVVRIERPSHENALTEEQRNHPSETALDNYDFDITISATDKEELEYAVCEHLLPRIDGLDGYSELTPMIFDWEGI